MNIVATLFLIISLLSPFAMPLNANYAQAKTVIYWDNCDYENARIDTRARINIYTGDGALMEVIRLRNMKFSKNKRGTYRVSTTIWWTDLDDTRPYDIGVRGPSGSGAVSTKKRKHDTSICIR